MARRGIPPVRQWLVNYWRGGKIGYSERVSAPTKFLAQLASYGRLLPANYERVTVSPVRAFACPLCGQRITDGRPCGCGARY